MHRERKLRRWEQFPHVVTLPSKAEPNISVYGPYVIVSQRAVLNTWEDAKHTVRSREPFILAYRTRQGTFLVGSKIDRRLERL